MSFSSDLWNGFDILKKNFLHTYNKLKHFYEIMFAFASLEKNHSKNLEILYEQNKDLFNSDEILLLSSKTFISSLKIESEYHKYYYNNIFDNILSPIKDIIDNKKNFIIKNFNDNMNNSEKFKKIIQNIISKQENYYNSCKELSLCLSDIEIYAQNNETKKKQGVSKVLLNKKDKALEKVNRTQSEYLNIATESNIILKDYNLKTETLLNSLEKEFIEINTCVKDCLIKYSKNKNQLYKDILEMTNHGLSTCYDKIDVEKEMQNFVMRNATKEFKYHKFEYNPFKLNNINKNLLFSETSEASKLQGIDCDRVIQKVRKFFIDNKITGSDSDYIERMINALKEDKLLFSIKYDSIIEMNANEENKNLINDLIKNENININNTDKNKNKNNDSNSKIVEKQKEIINNIKYIEKFVNKLTNGEQDLENDINKIKTILQNNKEKYIYSENFLKGLDSYRSHGNYILNEKSYEYFLNLFSFILDNFKNNDFIIKNIIILSQTFYKIRPGSKNPKYYILYSISNHSIFNKSETWHKIINYSLTNYSVNKDLSIKMEKEQREKKLNEHIFNILVENLSIMKVFRVNEKIFNEVKNYYIQVYGIDKELVKKEINNFYKDNNFSINEENEKELIKGENKEFLAKNLEKNEDKDNIISEENNKIIENKEEINKIIEEKDTKNEENKEEESKDKLIENKEEIEKEIEKEKEKDDKVDNNE